MNKNDIFQIRIEDMTDNGEGIGRFNGYTLFVKDTVVGDVIEGKVIKAKKNYGYGRLMKIIEPSSDRVIPPCPVAGPCGGCQLQALSYEAQLRYKYNRVLNHIKRIGGFEDITVEPVLGMQPEEYDSEYNLPLRYRNKAQYPIGRSKDGRIIAGFYAGRTHSIIECPDCLLLDPVNSDILDIVISHMEKYNIEPYNEETHKGLVRHVLIRKGYHTGELMVCIVINGTSIKAADELADRLSTIKGMTSICLNVNREKGNVILGRQIINILGPGYIEDMIKDIRYRISPLSFFQVNPIQTERLYSKVLEFAALTGHENVWDLYCGIGTISLFLARSAGRVYGVEIIPAAIENAKENAGLNGISNAEFFVGKSEEVLPEKYIESNRTLKADVIVVDPPRKGCDEELLDVMASMSPERIVYVSCDSATLARDLKYLCGRGYDIKKVQPVDMFAMTCHVETVVLLSQQKADDYVEVVLKLDELDVTSAESKATYAEIKDYVKDKYGVNVHTSYIAQVKRMCGLDMGENYNKSKRENPEVKQCPQEKVEYIKDALKHFGLV